MEYILLDTNILIYREGEKVLDQDIQLLSRLLMDSNDFRLCIHPLSIEELSKHKDKKQREVILSKITIYRKLVKPPKATLDFTQKCGTTGNSHDFIDDNLLYMLDRNCVSYLITNDKKIKKKAEKLGLKNRVLSILDAIGLLSNGPDEVLLKTPAIVQEELLYNIDTTDTFFDSLSEDYKGFEEWLDRKKRSQMKAHITYMGNGKIGSLLMLKIEDIAEVDKTFDIPLKKARRVKISTFKVVDNGKSIGEAFIKIATDFALKSEIEELYVTIFDRQEMLIRLFQEYGFELYTYKDTEKKDGSIEKEGVYLKKFQNTITSYPIVKLDNQKIYIAPIQEEFSRMLFPDIYESQQLSFEDLEGTSTYSNVIKKVYISRSKISLVEAGDILVFYVSQVKKAIACVGVVDDIFRANEIGDFEAFEKIVKRRTVYPISYLKMAYEKGYLIILFKYYINLPNHVPLDTAKRENLLKGAPQAIQTFKRNKFLKLVKISGSERQIKI